MRTDANATVLLLRTGATVLLLLLRTVGGVRDDAIVSKTMTFAALALKTTECQIMESWEYSMEMLPPATQWR